jgi:hypothetical protein
MKTLPLKEAYRFGAEHGLEREIAAIRDMEIEWDLSYTSSLRRGFVVDLFTKRHLLDQFKQQYWPAGDSPWGQRKTAFWLRLKGRYEDFLAGRDDATLEVNDEEEEDQTFAAETDLRDFLANNLGCVEPGLRLYQHGEQKGLEFPVHDGRIDILAVDKTGRFVVFELKLARGRNKALGQILYYMAWVDKHLGNGPCRGIIIAKEITDDLVLAVQRAQGVTLYRYKLSVSVERVSPGAGMS